MSRTDHPARAITLEHTGNRPMVATCTPEDGAEPLILYIGTQADTDALQRAANRHGLALGALVAFRDGAPP